MQVKDADAGRIAAVAGEIMPIRPKDVPSQPVLHKRQAETTLID
jgi:hypothetical protein